MITYRKITDADLSADTFINFHHDQHWNRQWVKHENTWMLEAVCGNRQWNAEKRIWVSEYLKQQIKNGGCVVAAFTDAQIIAFACIDGNLIGHPVCYSNLTMLFVDDRFQRLGIGKKLLGSIKNGASKIGADRLFISAIPSEDTIAFYFAIGCKDAECIIPEFVDTENDRFLELHV